MSNHPGDDKIRFTELAPALRHRGLTISRTIDVLEQLELFDNNKTPAFEGWLERKLAGLTRGIRDDVESWLRVLRYGGPRMHARNLETTWSYLNQILWLLRAWSQRFGHLREITRRDILEATDPLHGSNRHITICVPRSLFRYCKKSGTIFRDPTVRIRPTQVQYSAILPLEPQDIREAIDAASTPAHRLAVVLSAVHAARTKDIFSLHLDDVDLGNRRLVIGGRVRPLDEALAHGPDPLHLSAVFGLSDQTAIRYATAARHILQTPAEHHAIPSSIEPTRSPTLPCTNEPLGSR